MIVYLLPGSIEEIMKFTIVLLCSAPPICKKPNAWDSEFINLYIHELVRLIQPFLKFLNLMSRPKEYKNVTKIPDLRLLNIKIGLSF